MWVYYKIYSLIKFTLSESRSAPEYSFSRIFEAQEETYLLDMDPVAGMPFQLRDLGNCVERIWYFTLYPRKGHPDINCSPAYYKKCRATRHILKAELILTCILKMRHSCARFKAWHLAITCYIEKWKKERSWRPLLWRVNSLCLIKR